MARTDTLGNFLTDVAEAIRAKEGTTEKIHASDFDTRISNLPSGSGDGENLTSEVNTYGDELEEQNITLVDIINTLADKSSGGEIIEVTKEYEYKNGEPSTVSSNSASVTNLGSFWMNDMDEMIGGKLKSVTLYATKSGTITFRANNSVTVAGDITPLSAYTDYAIGLEASSTTFNLFRLNVTAGLQTYLLDGTDSRVTILNQAGINKCPKIIGVASSSDTAVFRYNLLNLPNNGRIKFFHTGYDGSTIPQSYQTALGISFKYEKTELVVSDGTEEV